MKQSEIENAKREAVLYFQKQNWHLPPDPDWDITDFGLGNFRQCGLVLINLCLEPEYCEKIMYATKDQVTPPHYHKIKKEDIIVREGKLSIQLWKNESELSDGAVFDIKVNNKWQKHVSGDHLLLASGERVTIFPEQVHQFFPVSEACIIGEVSTANDDVNDNYFIDPCISRFGTFDKI